MKLDERGVLGGQPGVDQKTEERDADGIGHFQNDADRQGDESRRPSADLEHGAEDVAAWATGKKVRRCC